MLEQDKQAGYDPLLEAARVIVDIEEDRSEFQDPQELILRLRRNVADYNEIAEAIIDYFQAIKQQSAELLPTKEIQ